VNDTTPPTIHAPAPTLRPTFAEAFRFWLKLGFISFGGPSGQIAIMHAELVEKKQWISEGRFLHALNYCMLLPGPEAQQLSIYLGWLLHRTWGGIVAGAFFVLPSALILWLLSLVYVTYGKLPVVIAIFDGLKPAVIAIVAAAVLRIGSRALKNAVMWTLAALAFAAIYFLGAPFPLIIAAAALVGFVGGVVWPEKFQVLKGQPEGLAGGVMDEAAGNLVAPSWGRALRIVAVCLVAWWGPILATGWLLGWQHTLWRQGLFFGKAAMVTFGGAYAVLPYVSQQAVAQSHWLGAGQMMDGLALAETTPGPLIMVLQFVGFVGAWQQPAPFPPLVAATLGAAITTWATFVPCFLWIFLGAPYIERLREHARLNAALSAITAAVVGVILNLAVWFALHVLVPAGQAVNWWGAAVALVAFVGMQRWTWNIGAVVAGAAGLGLLKWGLGL